MTMSQQDTSAIAAADAGAVDERDGRLWDLVERQAKTRKGGARLFFHRRLLLPDLRSDAEVLAARPQHDDAHCRFGPETRHVCKQRIEHRLTVAVALLRSVKGQRRHAASVHRVQHRGSVRGGAVVIMIMLPPQASALRTAWSG